MQSRGVRRPSVRPSVCLSVCKLCANRFFSQAIGWNATKLAHDGSQPGLHPCTCAQGQGRGQRSRDTGTSVTSRNICYTVRSHVLSLHANKDSGRRKIASKAPLVVYRCAAWPWTFTSQRRDQHRMLQEILRGRSCVCACIDGVCASAMTLHVPGPPGVSMRKFDPIDCHEVVEAIRKLLPSKSSELRC